MMLPLFLSALLIGLVKGLMDWLGDRITYDRASYYGPRSFAGMWR